MGGGVAVVALAIKGCLLELKLLVVMGGELIVVRLKGNGSGHLLGQSGAVELKAGEKGCAWK